MSDTPDTTTKRTRRSARRPDDSGNPEQDQATPPAPISTSASEPFALSTWPDGARPPEPEPSAAAADTALAVATSLEPAAAAPANQAAPLPPIVDAAGMVNDQDPRYQAALQELRDASSAAADGDRLADQDPRWLAASAELRRLCGVPEMSADAKPGEYGYGGYGCGNYAEFPAEDRAR